MIKNNHQDRCNERSRAIKSAEYSLINYLLAESIERVWCFTDKTRQWLAEAYLEAAKKLELKGNLFVFSEAEYSEQDLQPISRTLEALSENDLVLAIFSDGIERTLPYYRIFPAFSSPKGYSGYSAVIRPRYFDQALLEHLTTEPQSVEKLIKEKVSLSNQQVRVVGTAGTDLTMQLKNKIILPYKITDKCTHAYLPPAELTFGIVPGSANGKIVVDVTVGEFVVKGKIIDPLGLVDQPVILTVENGYITQITGAEIAKGLKECFTQMKKEARLVVELGFGLSKEISPTGLIGVDESLQGTCHFGIGNNLFYGGKNQVPMHLDLVIKNPQIKILEEDE